MTTKIWLPSQLSTANSMSSPNPATTPNMIYTLNAAPPTTDRVSKTINTTNVTPSPE